MALLELAELEQLDEVNLVAGQVHDQGRVGLAAVEVRESDDAAELASLCKQKRWERVGFRRVRVDAANAQGAHHLVGAQEHRVPVEVAAGLVSGADGEAGQACFSLTSEGVLQRRVLLALQFEEIADGEVFGF